MRPDYKNTEEAYKAIREMTALLGDKFTRFLTPAQYLTLSNMYTTEAPAAGVGVELNLADDGKVMVVGVVEGSPAEKAGIVKGDVLRAVDDDAVGPGTVSSTPDEVAALLRGEDGSEVTITVGRPVRERPSTL